MLTSEGLDRLTGKNLYLKAENFQKTGSFKGRGALNGVKCALERNPQLKGVITNSSGNFGMALAWAAGQSSLKCTVVVPDNAPEYKVAGIEAYGADVVRCAANLQARHETCERLATELGYEAIDPHNHFDVMAGQGTIAKELLEQVPNLDAIIVSLGGGGLSAGIAKYVKEAHPNVKVFLCEPEGKHFEKQMTSGVRVVTPDLLQTMADGIRIKEVGDNCFPVLCECAQRTVLTISEDEIKCAMRLIWERLKVVVEASAALPLAAVLKYKEELRDFHIIGLILCGGNLNIDAVFA